MTKDLGIRTDPYEVYMGNCMMNEYIGHHTLKHVLPPKSKEDMMNVFFQQCVINKFLTFLQNDHPIRPA